MSPKPVLYTNENSSLQTHVIEIGKTNKSVLSDGEVTLYVVYIDSVCLVNDLPTGSNVPVKCSPG